MLNLKNTLDGYLKNVEVIGNTVQDTNNLANIRSVGDKVEGQELYKIPVVSCGKNLFDGVVYKENGYFEVTGQWAVTNTLDTYLIKVSPNTTYTKNSYWNGINCYFDKDMNCIGGENTLVFTTPANCYYVSCSINKDIDKNKVQLELGNQVTSYEPYKENKLEILSPVQLEKVGDVADRIICKDGVWGIEKNIGILTLSGQEVYEVYAGNITNRETATVYFVKNIDYDVLGISRLYTSLDKVISNKFTGYVYCWDSNKINTLSMHPSLNTIYFTVDTSIDTVDKFKEHIRGTIIKFPTLKPQFIPLPHDQQVKLRTSAGQTNIAFLTEIPGQIKAQVPKSLGATVNTHTEQIADLHNSLERVKKLEETTVSTIETERNFTTVDATSNGYFEGVKLEGKTLVNVLRLAGNWFEQETTLQTDSTTAVGLSQCTKSQDLSLLKSNTTYTVVPFIDYTAIKKGNLYLQLNTEINGIQNAVFRIDESMFNKPTLITTKELTNKNSRSLFLGGTNCEYKVKNVKILMLEGDHTNNPPSYFGGLMSVGQDVEEVSVKSRNANLFDYNNIYVQETYTGIVNTQLIPDGVKILNLAQLGFGNLLKIRKGVTYYFKGCIDNIANVRVFPRGKYDHADAICEVTTTGVNEFSLTFTAPKDMEVLFRFWKGEGVATISNIVISKSAKTDNLLVNKKPILYYNPTTETWEKPILREWDTIEKHSDGKYYYHKRSGEVVLNGSEMLSIEMYNDGENYLQFNIKFDKHRLDSHFAICDKFPNVRLTNQYDFECFSMHSQRLIIVKLLKSKLSTQDVAGFKAWLKANPTTVVYQLKQEEVYECTNIDLMTYSGETNYIINSGAISPKSLLKVHNNISNVVKILQEKVSLLENTFIAGLRSVLSGDMYSLATILYPEDFEQNDNTEQDIMVIPE